jgi:tRNA(Ile)-lysidine synthase
MASTSVVDTVLTTIQDAQLLAAGDTLVVGVSGGPDSLCLLHALMQLQAQLSINLHAAHLNHSIRGEEAATDAAFVAKLAAQWGLLATVEQVDVPALARSQKIAIEEAARCARYAFLARTARRIGAARIAVAHNADDQTETVLMHWLRGSGLGGLRGMLPAIPLSEYRLVADTAAVAEIAPNTEAWTDIGALAQEEGRPDLLLIRPLLRVPRAEVEAYCKAHQLQPRHDRSNLDTTYFRNRLRHKLIPELETYNPNIREVVRRAAEVVAADYELLRQTLETYWPQVILRETQNLIRFDLAAWQTLPLSLRRSTIREAVHRLRHQLRNINFVHVEDAVKVAERGETGLQATLPQGLILTVGYTAFDIADEAFVPMPDLPLLLEDEPLPINVPGRTQLPDTAWSLKVDAMQCPTSTDFSQQTGAPHSEWDVVVDGDILGEAPFLRQRRTGDRFCPLGLSGHSKSVQAFMINEKVPVAWRDHLPILVNAEREIVWLAGLRIDHRARVTATTRRCVRLRFERQ